MRNVSVSAGFSVILLAVLAGCTSTLEPSASVPTPTAATGELTVELGLLTYESTSVRAGMTALFEGSLTLQTGCLGVGTNAFAFPSGMATWDGEVLTIRSETYRLGDSITVGGGEVSNAVLSPDVEDACGNNLIVVSG